MTAKQKERNARRAKKIVEEFIDSDLDTLEAEIEKALNLAEERAERRRKNGQ